MIWFRTRRGVYSVLIAWLSSYRGYSLLRGLRISAQNISYEIRLAFILLFFRFVPPVGFEPTISAGERAHTYAIDRAATGIDTIVHSG